MVEEKIFALCENMQMLTLDDESGRCLVGSVWIAEMTRVLARVDIPNLSRVTVGYGKVSYST